MTAKSFARMTLLASALALAVPAFAAEPTIHDVYVAAEAGKYTDAQALMDQVLKAHPKSGTAHFVEAELLAKQGKFAAAQGELATAERLSPGLPKVDPAALTKLRTLLADGQKPRANYSQQQPARSNAGYSNGNYGAPQSSDIPWGTILILGGGLLGFIWLATRFMSRRNQQTDSYNNPAGFNPGGGAAPGYAPGAYPQQGYPQPGYGQPQGSGIGSRIMGGLATGAAVGAGIVAGEAIARQFTGGNHDSGNRDQPRNDIVYDDPSRDELLRRDDMGGNDFGVSGGWDDGGSGGGDSGGGGGGDWD
ncbi:tetratricopeptide repeat protein [Duganella sp. BJB488]|uniref:tetratricopeptide repeat protein n=1 Tax=unclassified Duganella TaxID=2636909 RepID=UPI000E345497|nr:MULTISPECIES: tetratricopeptide repeat protein [unclassified Duganella]RFP12284.1 tetratricopeptide repeat protein [Duganella sp. BJB488]RFP20076.1 tetratricopeptide repeat protein [Duganella sp. BJB489]RFP33617.1 tetratricopeptide repeat protein [Duganella sp. BJB480]